MAEPSRQEIKLFYCYAHEDKTLRDELQVSLAGLRRQYQLANWYDREILPGEKWEEAIDKHLSTADVILLLISPHFVDSDYCYGKEMQQALERHHAGNCCVIPILLRPTYWEETPFSTIQMLPTDARPVTSWSDRYEAFHDVAKGISAAIKALITSRTHELLAAEAKGRRFKVENIPNYLQKNKQNLRSELILASDKRNPTVIDLSIKAALEIGADKHPISLADLHNTYLRTNPGITKSLTRASFDAAINYHTINMRSRFFYPDDRRKNAPWLSRPLFKRVARGSYMLLSPDEIALFRQRVQENDSRIYQDEYDVDDLI